MTRLLTVDAVDLFLRVLAGKEGAGESPPGTNRGPYVERLQKRCGGNPGDPWCADEMADTGALSLGPLWPVPLTGSCQALADFFKTKKVLYATPQRGDFWLRWDAKLGRFSHTGAVLRLVDANTIEVQAGNTVRPGQPGDIREGWLNWRRTEPINPKDRFGRWVELL